jgi:hypothetical protein
MFNAHWFVYFCRGEKFFTLPDGLSTIISVSYTTAWASALLILGCRQCESLRCGMSDEFQDPALFCMAFYDKVGTSGLGFAGKILF